nr:class I SAM-dependent methyltransferase [Kineosphaera limosa]
MRELADWTGRRVLDVGCGTGYHLPLFAERAARVVGVEPHPPLVATARARVADLPNVEVLEGLAQELPLPDAGIDVAHARWAYFFGPGCEDGLEELTRVMAPGGTAFIIDNDASRSTFGRWFRRQWPAYDAAAIERFWTRRGWQRRPLLIRWEQPTRADFEAVVCIEFNPELARDILRTHDGTQVDYAVNLWWRCF